MVGLTKVVGTLCVSSWVDCLGSQAVLMVLESKGETAVQMMVKLLKAFWKTGLITLDQMNRVRTVWPASRTQLICAAAFPACR